MGTGDQGLSGLDWRWHVTIYFTKEGMVTEVDRKECDMMGSSLSGRAGAM